MARRGEEFSRLGHHGGYTQALTLGKGFSGTERSDAKAGRKQKSGRDHPRRHGGGTMSAYEQHLQLIQNYHRYNLHAKVPGSGAVDAKGLQGRERLTEGEALRRQYRFVRDDKEDRRAEQVRGLQGEAVDPTAWEVRMAARYYKLLFKEYALADLSRYREGKIGLRWRTEKDVISGKEFAQHLVSDDPDPVIAPLADSLGGGGVLRPRRSDANPSPTNRAGQFECGSLTCSERVRLHSYELNFKYKEAGEVKNELVKVRVCPQCARKLFYKKIEALRLQREQEAEADLRRKGNHSSHSSSSGEGAERSEKSPEKQERHDPGDSPADGHELVQEAARATQAVDHRQRRGAEFERRSTGGKSSGSGSGSGSGLLYYGGDGERSEKDSRRGGGDDDALPDGHELVRQAMAMQASVSGASGTNALGGSRKRGRSSRWGETQSAPQAPVENPAIGDRRAAMAAEGVGTSEGQESTGAGEETAAVKSQHEASRRAWAGELQRDRTAEDEMDDYLSTLLL